MSSDPIAASSGVGDKLRRLPIIGKHFDRLITIPSPFYHRNSPGEAALANLLAEVAEQPDAQILNIGSRSDRDDTINLDIVQNGGANVIGDATYMPFADFSFDLIINIAVMEHVRFPNEIAAECYRVLKPGGKIYCGIPFFQMYHADPIDMQRYTITGITNLFREFKAVENGIELGPASATAIVVREFLSIAFCFNSALLYNTLQLLFGYITFPIKLFDHYMARSKFAYMIPCAVYFIGEKQP